MRFKKETRQLRIGYRFCLRVTEKKRAPLNLWLYLNTCNQFSRYLCFHQNFNYNWRLTEENNFCFSFVLDIVSMKNDEP
jgi:hypothetical protein